MTDEQTPRAAVPADIHTPDTVAFGLTFRQLAIIAAAGFTGWTLYRHLGTAVPGPVWVLAAIPAAALTVTVALGRRDGLPLDVWLRHALALRTTARLQAPGGVPGRPLVQTQPVPAPAPLRPAAVAVTDAGVLTTDGRPRRLIACGTTNIGLRSSTEQAAQLSGFAAWLHAIGGPAQIVVSARRHNLTPAATAAADRAATLPHPRLRAAATGYAGFLHDLDTTRAPLRRQVIAVVAAGPPAQTTVRALTALGVSAVALDGPAVTAALAEAADPYLPPVPGPRAVPGTPITSEAGR